MTLCPGLLLNFGMMIMVLTNVLTMPPPVQLSVFDYNGVSDDSTVTVPVVSPADGKAPIPEQAGVSPLAMGKVRLTEWNSAVEPLATERTVIFPPPSSEMPRFSNGGDNSKGTAPGVWLRYEWGMGAGVVERENTASPSERVTNLTVPSTGPTATTAQGWLKSNCKSQCFVGCNYSLFRSLRRMRQDTGGIRHASHQLLGFGRSRRLPESLRSDQVPRARADVRPARTQPNWFALGR